MVEMDNGRKLLNMEILKSSVWSNREYSQPSVGMRLEGKVAIITGGASGIGEASVRLFVQNGALVVVADIQDEKGLQLVQELGDDKVAYKHCDVSQEQDVETLVDFAVKKWARLDVMFNNAGILGDNIATQVSTIDMADFDRVMGVNARGMVLGVKHASRHMLNAKTKGSIICTASVAGVTGGVSPVAYAMSKHAIVGLVRAASSDLGQYGIRVNCISPSAVVTPFMMSYVQRKLATDASMSLEQVQAMYDEASCFDGHSASPLDIANAALFLASDDASFISGHNLVVDGGLTAKQCKVMK